MSESDDEHRDLYRDIPDEPDRFGQYPYDDPPLNFGEQWDIPYGELMVSSNYSEWLVFYGELAEREDYESGEG